MPIFSLIEFNGSNIKVHNLPSIDNNLLFGSNNLHLIDTVSSLEGSLFNLLNFVSAHVENFQIGEPIEKSEGGYLPNVVICEHEVGRGGRDASRDVLEAAVGTIHFGSVTSDKKISILASIPATPVTQSPALRRTQGILLAAVSGRPRLAWNISIL